MLRSSLSGFCISSGSDEPLDIPALSGRANPGMPATRQQAEEEERAATAVALEEAQGQAEQAAAAERAARDALEADLAQHFELGGLNHHLIPRPTERGAWRVVA